MFYVVTNQFCESRIISEADIYRGLTAAHEYVVFSGTLPACRNFLSTSLI